MSLAPPATLSTNTANATGSGRNKVALKPGHSLMDWIRLRNDRSVDLSGVGGPGLHGPVSEDELAKRKATDDAWIAVRGKVYNITPYLDFHPGGVDEIMKGAGKDATELIDEIHKWVNVESMLAYSYVGPLVQKPSDSRSKFRKSGVSPFAAPRSNTATLQVPSPTASSLSSSPQKPKKLSRILSAVTNKKSFSDLFKRKSSDTSSDGRAAVLEVSNGAPSSLPTSPVNQRKMGQIASRDRRRSSLPAVLVPNQKGTAAEEQAIPQPHYEWNETVKMVTVSFYSTYKELEPGDVVVDAQKADQLTVTIYLRSMMYRVSGDLYAAISELSVNFVDKRCDICLTKQETMHWPVLHKDDVTSVTFSRRKNSAMKYYECTVKDVKQVTHDTKLFVVEFPPLTYVSIPVGHHIYIRKTIEGCEVNRPYTPVINLQGEVGYESGRSILLMIKIYPSGALTQHLVDVEVGSKIELSNQDGKFQVDCLDRIVTLCLVGAGSGFTPMAKLIRTFLEKIESVEDVGSTTFRRVKLLCANKTEGDRMWKEELAALQVASNGRFEVLDTLSQPSSEWSGHKGRVTKQMLEDFFPSSEEEGVLVCYCGNMAFNNMMRRFLRQLGFTDKQCHLFN